MSDARAVARATVRLRRGRVAIAVWATGTLAVWLCGCAGPAVAPSGGAEAASIDGNWKVLAADPRSGATWSYEPDGIERTERGGRLWIRRAGDKAALVEGLKAAGAPAATLAAIERDYAYTLDLVHVNCADRSLWRAASGFYDARGVVIASSLAQESSPRFVRAEPDSPGSLIVGLVCGATSP